HRGGQPTHPPVSPRRYRRRSRSRVFSESTSESRRTSTWTIRDPFVATSSGRTPPGARSATLVADTANPSFRRAALDTLSASRRSGSAVGSRGEPRFLNPSMHPDSGAGGFKAPVELSISVVLSLNLPQRCLLYLLDRGDLREDDPAAQEVTQDRIAEAIGTRRAHVSRAMTKMEASGLVRTGKVHVAGESRRRLAYFLREPGLRTAASTRSELEEETVRVTDLQGLESKRHLYEVPRLLSRRRR